MKNHPVRASCRCANCKKWTAYNRLYHRAERAEVAARRRELKDQAIVVVDALSEIFTGESPEVLEFIRQRVLG